MKLQLGMYCLEELLTYNKVWSTVVEKHSADLGVSEDITVKQICGWPFVSGDRGLYRLVAVPMYDPVATVGCKDHFYSSALIVRSNSKVGQLKELEGKVMAVNSLTSCSGYLLPASALGPFLFSTMTEYTTGSHLQSLKAVATGKADFAGIDCVTLAHIKQHKPQLYSQIKILEFTQHFPALPYVTDITATDETVELLREALRRSLTDPEAAEAVEMLFINGLCYDDIDYDSYTKEIYAGLMRNELQGERLGGIKGMEDFLVGGMKGDRERVQLAVKMIKKCKVSSGNSLEFYDDEGRYVRVVKPGNNNDNNNNNESPLEDLSVRNCVGFFGRKARLHLMTEDTNEVFSRCCRIDESMVAELDPNVVELYFSMQVTPGGDYFNVVVFRKDKCVSDFLKLSSSFHTEAMRSVSPKYYSRVWIHRLKVDLKEEEEVEVVQTTAVEYERGVTLMRHVFNWGRA